MRLIIGLGNPGKKYNLTRHNVGFLVIESFKSEINNFSDWKHKKKFQAEISQGRINNQEVILAKPQTFMNNSGTAVKSLIKNLKQGVKDLIVIHDDIDLPLSKIKISKDRGAAGHKGVESIIQALGTKDFCRVRIGIQPKAGKPSDVEKLVLQKFKKEEEEILKKTIKEAIQSIQKLS